MSVMRYAPLPAGAVSVASGAELVAVVEIGAEVLDHRRQWLGAAVRVPAAARITRPGAYSVTQSHV